MGTLINFPKDRIVQRVPAFSVNRPPAVKVWRMVDLDGQRPEGHPELRRGPRGGVIAEVDQVWVGLSTDLLWVVTHLDPFQHLGTYRSHVWLYPYKAPDRRYGLDISEKTLRESHKVWEDMVTFKQSLIQSIDAECGSGATSFRQFCGLDEEGNRIEL